MNKQQINTITTVLSVMEGAKLQNVRREGFTMLLELGDLFEREITVETENEKQEKKTLKIAPYTLHIDCDFRMICNSKVIIGRTDVYAPTSKHLENEDFDWGCFDWDTEEGNRFDELLPKYFSDDFSEYIIGKISVNKFGDLKIKFLNGFEFEAYIDTSGNDECWSFFETGNNGKPHLVVSGKGIEKDIED